jgi:hypothetical protein
VSESYRNDDTPCVPIWREQYTSEFTEYQTLQQEQGAEQDRQSDIQHRGTQASFAYQSATREWHLYITMTTKPQVAMKHEVERAMRPQ